MWESNHKSSTQGARRANTPPLVRPLGLPIFWLQEVQRTEDKTRCDKVFGEFVQTFDWKLQVWSRSAEPGRGKA